MAVAVARVKATAVPKIDLVAELNIAFLR